MRRNVFLLGVLSVASGLLLAGAGLLAASWTYDAVRVATETAHALRAHGHLERMHDALRADVLSFTAGEQGPQARADFERHLAELEASAETLRRSAVPDPIAQAIKDAEPEFQRYVLLGRRILEQPAGAIPAAELSAFTSQWRALESRLQATSERLEETVATAYSDAEAGFFRLVGFVALAALATVAGLAVMARRVSQSVLATNAQLLSARRTAERALAMKSDFLAVMSHELRTPLTGVLGMVDLLSSERLDENQRSYVKAIHASGRHLLNIINDILDYTRLETGTIELEHVDFALPDLLERVRSLVQPMAVERGLELRFELSEQSPPLVRGDPTRIKQVLLNLVGNAIKFTERGSVSLLVSQRPEEDGRVRLRFEVKDTGIGVPPEELAELFAEFTQADSSTARRFGGTGLGLAISKLLVEAMGGEIGATSTVGRGSVFWFEIPCEIGRAAKVAEVAGLELAVAQPRRILIAEDVEVNRALLRDVLTREGHEVVFATNGAEALALVQERPFDVILMDVQMPVMDGVEATRRIRRLPGPAGRIPIVGLTANVMAQEREQYLAAGMTECLMKPIDWELLTAALARHGGSGCSVSEDQRPEAPGPEPPPTPLLDYARVGALQARIGQEQIAALAKRGIDDAERLADKMAELPAGSAELTREAHNVKGTSGTLGLLRVSQVAADIEQAARSGHAVAHLRAALAEAVTATRAELQRSVFGSDQDRAP